MCFLYFKYHPLLWWLAFPRYGARILCVCSAPSGFWLETRTEFCHSRLTDLEFRRCLRTHRFLFARPINFFWILLDFPLISWHFFARRNPMYTVISTWKYRDVRNKSDFQSWDMKTFWKAQILTRKIIFSNFSALLESNLQQRGKIFELPLSFGSHFRFVLRLWEKRESDNFMWSLPVCQQERTVQIDQWRRSPEAYKERTPHPFLQFFRTFKKSNKWQECNIYNTFPNKMCTRASVTQEEVKGTNLDDLERAAEESPPGAHQGAHRIVVSLDFLLHHKLVHLHPVPHLQFREANSPATSTGSCSEFCWTQSISLENLVQRNHQIEQITQSREVHNTTRKQKHRTFFYHIVFCKSDSYISTRLCSRFTGHRMSKTLQADVGRPDDMQSHWQKDIRSERTGRATSPSIPNNSLWFCSPVSRCRACCPTRTWPAQCLRVLPAFANTSYSTMCPKPENNQSSFHDSRQTPVTRVILLVLEELSQVDVALLRRYLDGFVGGAA